MKFEIKMNQPQKLRIGAHEVQLEFLPKDSPVFGNSSEEYTWGCWDVDKRKICIRDDLDFSMFLSTLLHELYHVFEDLYGVKVSHKDLNLVADLYGQVLISNFQHVDKRKKREE